MDVVDLREFYASPLGLAARRLLTHRLRARLKGVRGKEATVLGLGYAVPFLTPWQDEAGHVIALMPARQGVVHWPEHGPYATALADEGELPLDDGSVDLAVVVHGLELTDQLPAMLAEMWRVLAPQGRAVFVVPNRRGLWARFDSTPFGHGRPFSRQQLTQLLRDAQFTPSGWSHGLFVPPVNRRFFTGSAPAWERVGLAITPAFAGVLIVEAMKQVYAMPRRRSPAYAGGRLRPGLLPSPV